MRQQPQDSGHGGGRAPALGGGRGGSAAGGLGARCFVIQCFLTWTLRVPVCECGICFDCESGPASLGDRPAAGSKGAAARKRSAALRANPLVSPFSDRQEGDEFVAEPVALPATSAVRRVRIVRRCVLRFGLKSIEKAVSQERVLWRGAGSQSSWVQGDLSPSRT